MGRKSGHRVGMYKVKGVHKREVDTDIEWTSRGVKTNVDA